LKKNYSRDPVLDIVLGKRSDQTNSTLSQV
jgi:hypothetical protein